LAEIEIGTTSFRIRDKQLEVLYGQEWLQVWEFRIVENWGDLALDTDLEKDEVSVCRRTSPQEPNVSRLITDDDIALFKLENGKTLAMLVTPKLNEMIKLLVAHGIDIKKGSNVKRKTPYKE